MTKTSFLFQLKLLNLFSNCQTYQSYHHTHTGRVAVSKILFVFFSFIYLLPFLHAKSLVMSKKMKDKSVFVWFDDQRYYYGQMFVFKWCSTILHQENTTNIVEIQIVIVPVIIQKDCFFWKCFQVSLMKKKHRKMNMYTNLG